MTDKEIDQRLHDALTPDVPENRLFVFKEMTKESEGTTMKLKKILKPAIVVAACAALILGASRVPDFVSLKKAVSSDEPGTFSEKLANAFTVKVLAAGKKKEELKKDSLIESKESFCSAWSAGDGKHEISFVEAFPITCEGNNIDKITYSINKGAFQIYHKTGDNFLVDGEKYSNQRLNVGGIPPEAWGDYEEGSGYEEGYYTSFSVSPDFQESKNVRINICDNRIVSKETKESIFSWYTAEKKGMNLQKLTKEQNSELRKLEAKGHNDLFNDIVINCIVTYKDGSTESKEIKVKAVVKTPREVDPNGKWSKDMIDSDTVFTAYTIQ